MKFKNLKWLLPFAVLAALVAVAYHLQAQRSGPASASDEARLSPSHELVCQGYVDMLDGVTLLAVPAACRVQEVLVAENEHVTAGQPLLRFDEAQARAAVAEARTLVSAAEGKLKTAQHAPEQHSLQLKQQQAAVDGMQANLEVARHREALHRGWYRSETTSDTESSDADKADTEKKATEKPAGSEGAAETPDESLPSEEREAAIAKEQVKAAEAALAAEQAKLEILRLTDPAAELKLLQVEVERAQTKLRQAEISLEQCTLPAPEAGQVLRVLVRPGQIGPLQPAVYFAADEERVVRVEIEQAYVEQVAAGAPVVLYEDRQPDRLYRGRVLRLAEWYSRPRLILEEAVNFADVRTVECVIAVEAEGGTLRIGQRMWARIQAGTAQSGSAAGASAPDGTAPATPPAAESREPAKAPGDSGADDASTPEKNREM